MISDESPPGMDQLLDGPELAEALGSDMFKQFLDQVPFAIAVSKLNPAERVVYANIQFQTLTGQDNATMVGGSWEPLLGQAVVPVDIPKLISPSSNQWPSGSIFRDSTNKQNVDQMAPPRKSPNIGAHNDATTARFSVVTAATTSRSMLEPTSRWMR